MKLRITVNGTGGELCSATVDVEDQPGITLREAASCMREEHGYDIDLTPGDTIVITEVR